MVTTHQHQTRCSEVWTLETMQLRTVCDNLRLVGLPITSESFEAKISINIQQTSYFFLTFYDFLIRHFKKRKKSCFFEIWKRQNTYSRTLFQTRKFRRFGFSLSVVRAKRYIPTAKVSQVSEEVNRKWPARNMMVQLSTPTPTVSPRVLCKQSIIL